MQRLRLRSALATAVQDEYGKVKQEPDWDITLSDGPYRSSAAPQARASRRASQCRARPSSTKMASVPDDECRDGCGVGQNRGRHVGGRRCGEPHQRHHRARFSTMMLNPPLQ
jgi:hypothetical protein